MNTALEGKGNQKNKGFWRKPPKRRLWRMKRGGFEEVSRFSRPKGAGNRLTRRCSESPKRRLWHTFPSSSFFLSPAAYFLSTATKSMQKAPPETNGLWTPFTFKNYRSLWAVAGTDSATDPLPLPLRRRSVWVYGFEYGFPRRVYAPARNDRIIL